jgi:hypothetical protein
MPIHGGIAREHLPHAMQPSNILNALAYLCFVATFAHAQDLELDTPEEIQGAIRQFQDLQSTERKAQDNDKREIDDLQKTLRSDIDLARKSIKQHEVNIGQIGFKETQASKALALDFA